MKKNVIIIVSVVLVIATGFFFLNEDAANVEELFVLAKKGEFQIDISTTGELEAKNSVNILGPTGLRRAQIWQVKIDHIINEGTEVKKGDYIAQLDKSEVMDKINKADTDFQQALSQYTQTKMDTALDLRKSRDELINLEFEVEEKQIIFDQSKFEPEATQRQTEIDLAKSKRKFEQAKQNYKLQTQKARAQMNEVSAKMSEARQRLEFLGDLSQQFTILASEPGMLIYKRNWRGQKLGIGSNVEPWDPVVATLPDLSKMVSKTYVNEVDIRIIKKGQLVELGLDAFPEKKLTGEVVEVANIGEQKPNTDSKVFEVLIQVNESDTTLRPAMTTSNKIVAEVIPDVVFVPLEAVHSQGDSISYVIKEKGTGYTRKEVKLGKSNSNEIIIESGVEEGEKILLSVPGDPTQYELIALVKKEE